ncbi:hypothetical protein [Vibrio agarivorans]|uniref:hypothetical protein n=1 Tax=Vibrio agarivorans TaxID=153622 RepID=UPI0025B5196B|nr:hypothetical protein [Vibrio agarivorans]MDN3661073.1 hypothetical protein [Vibrio agarivorans]
MFSAMKNTDVFHQLIQNDVVFKLAASYPSEGVIQTKDLMQLEEASANPDVKADLIRQIFQDIKVRDDERKIQQLKSKESAQLSSTERPVAHVQPQALNVLY